MRPLERPAVALVAAFVLWTLLPAAAAADAPRVFVYPNPATDGQQAVVYGQNFCGSSGCSDVTVSVDGRTVATGVKVKSDGSFAAGFTVTQILGQHTATATQTDAGGASISASGGFRVAAGDVTSTTPPTAPPSSRPPTPTSPSPTATGPVGGRSPSSGSRRSGGEPAVAGDAGSILGFVLALVVVLVLAGAAILLSRRGGER